MNKPSKQPLPADTRISKALHGFLTKEHYIFNDIELLDVMGAANTHNVLTTLPGKLFDHVDAVRHRRLSSGTTAPHRRKLLFAHAKNSIASAYLKELYEIFIIYLKTIVTDAATNCRNSGFPPGAIIGDHPFELNAAEVLQCGSWGATVAMIAEGLFRRLEELRSNTKLILQVSQKLGLSITKKSSTHKKALPYLEIRHLLVHKEGRSDRAFCQAYPEFNFADGEKMLMDIKMLQEASDAVTALAKQFDKEIVAKGLLAENRMHGKPAIAPD